MVKGKTQRENDGPVRERTICWDEDQTQFMLGWYIDLKKESHAGCKFKKTHHFKCAEALNRQFSMGVIVSQVGRHLRHYKENWKYIATALHKSSNAFDPGRCIVTISESKKAILNDRARRLLSKPIKFFHEMQELFSQSSADGSLAMDSFAAMNEKAESDESEGMNDMSTYADAKDVLGDDSDTIPSPFAPSSSQPCAGGDNTSSSSGVKRRRVCKQPPNRVQKPKSRMGQVTDEISTTLQALQQALVAPPPPPPPPISDPHAYLWERLEAMAITIDQKLTVGMFLANKDNKALCGFLCASSEKTFQTWVFKYLSDM